MGRGTLFRESHWVNMRIRKGERKRAFYPPGVKKEQDSYNPLVFYSVLSIIKILLEKQENRVSMDICLLKILFFFLLLKSLLSVLVNNILFLFYCF